MSKFGYEKFETVQELIANSDIVNVSVPLTDSTRNLIAGDTFDCFRKGAILVNAARGGIVNEQDLYHALKARKLRAAACDAFVTFWAEKNQLTESHKFSQEVNIDLRICKPLKNLFLPAGLIGGALALVLGPQVLGWIDIPSTWPGMATPMINVVLTTTIFGSMISKETLVGIALSKHWPDMPYAWGLMAIFTYWGGHGAATTAGTLFEGMGNAGMLSLGIIMATLGLIVAMLAGMVWVNIGARLGWSQYVKESKGAGEAPFLLADNDRRSLGVGTVSSDVVNGLALQLAIVLLCMFVGEKLFKSLALVPIPAFASVMKTIPALLYGIVGAFIVWYIMRKTHTDRYADLEGIKNIGGVAQEMDEARLVRAWLDGVRSGAWIDPERLGTGSMC